MSANAARIQKDSPAAHMKKPFKFSLILDKGGIIVVTKIVKPGQKVPDSGIYKSTRTGQKSTLVKDESAPPTPQKGEKWKQVIDTDPNKK